MADRDEEHLEIWGGWAITDEGTPSRASLRPWRCFAPIWAIPRIPPSTVSSIETWNHASARHPWPVTYAGVCPLFERPLLSRPGALPLEVGFPRLGRVGHWDTVTDQAEGAAEHLPTPLHGLDPTR